MSDCRVNRLRDALQAVADWEGGDFTEELYGQGILQEGDMPDWDEVDYDVHGDVDE